MLTIFSRRRAFQLAGAAALAQPRLFSFQQTPATPGAPGGPPGRGGRPPDTGMPAPNRRPGDRALAEYEAFPANNLRPTVSLVHGDNHRKNVHDALEAIDGDIRQVLRFRHVYRKKGPGHVFHAFPQPIQEFLVFHSLLVKKPSSMLTPGSEERVDRGPQGPADQTDQSSFRH